jgi:hypothetical protein
MFLFNHYYYLIILVLQAICVIHCIRKGTATNWIWVIIFLPLIGCLIYIFSEILSRSELKKVQAAMGKVINPGGTIKKLESNLRFSDTFQNRVLLADAYLAKNNIELAIPLYEGSMQGNFVENEYVLGQLIIAYFQAKRYEDIIPIAKKIYPLPQFARSRAHILYAMALGYTGNSDMAEKEFKLMKAKFANFEARYQYALFLEREGRKDDAIKVLSEIKNEATQLSGRERRYNSPWLSLSRNHLKELMK